MVIAKVEEIVMGMGELMELVQAGLRQAQVAREALQEAQVVLQGDRPVAAPQGLPQGVLLEKGEVILPMITASLGKSSVKH